MESCEFARNCLWHYRSEVMHNIVVYVHLLPWFPVIEVKLCLCDSFSVTLLHDKWEIYRDYDFALWWVFGSDED
jgi:uncharacterized membrane protein